MKVIYIHGYRREIKLEPSSKFLTLAEVISDSFQDFTYKEIGWTEDSDITELIESIKKDLSEDVLIIGHSTGAAIATMLYNTIDSNIIKKLVLMNPLIETDINILPKKLSNQLNPEYNNIQDSLILLSNHDELLDTQKTIEILGDRNGIIRLDLNHNLDNLISKVDDFKKQLINYINKYI